MRNEMNINYISYFYSCSFIQRGFFKNIHELEWIGEIKGRL